MKTLEKIEIVETREGLGEIQGGPGRVSEDLERFFCAKWVSRRRPNQFLMNFGRVLVAGWGLVGAQIEICSFFFKHCFTDAVSNDFLFIFWASEIEASRLIK